MTSCRQIGLKTTALVLQRIKSIKRADSPDGRERRERILERLKKLKGPRFGSKDFWQGCLEVEIATAEGFQSVSVQDGTPPSRLRAGELAMLVDDPKPWEELELHELEEWAVKLNLTLGAGRRRRIQADPNGRR
jgi:hypothetical protein